jgi:hypothetical protein
MRINVYSQELITDPEGILPDYEMVVQTANTGLTYSAVRVFLHSPDELHARPDDDDRSAITFWLPKSLERREYLSETFSELASLVLLAPPETGLD